MAGGGINNLLVTLEVHDVDDADALGNNALLKDGEIVGRATGGGLRFPRQQVAGAGHGAARVCRAWHELEIEILGKTYAATVVADSPFDPKNERLRDVNGAND